MPLTVAIDVGPLHGPRTGVGNAVQWTTEALRDDPAVTLRPYVTSMRARVRPPEHRLPIPAAGALRLWARAVAGAQTLADGRVMVATVTVDDYAGRRAPAGRARCARYRRPRAAP